MNRLSRLGGKIKQMMTGNQPAVDPVADKIKIHNNRVKSKAKLLPEAVTNLPATTKALTPQQKAEKAYKRPDIFVIRQIIMNGPMTSEQLWQAYQRQARQAKEQEKSFHELFKSKNELKQKTLSLMRQNGRIKSEGFNKTKKQHLGWTLVPSKAFKNIRSTLKRELKSLKTE